MRVAYRDDPRATADRKDVAPLVRRGAEETACRRGERGGLSLQGRLLKRGLGLCQGRAESRDPRRSRIAPVAGLNRDLLGGKPVGEEHRRALAGQQARLAAR